MKRSRGGRGFTIVEIILAMTILVIGVLTFVGTSAAVTSNTASEISNTRPRFSSDQRNHWFGYWFGHDMFTPPFRDPQTGQLSYDNVRRAELLKEDIEAKYLSAEMADK